jgi:tetratricopeptide (TPR) repeat protein
MPWRPKRPSFPWRTLAKVVLPIVALVVIAQVASYIVDLRSPPQRARKLRERAQLHWQVGQLDEAARALEEAMALQPDDGQSTVLLARLRQLQGRLDEAERSLRAALARRPQDPALAVSLARLLLDTERPLEAAEVLAPELSAIRKVTDPVQRIDALMVAARAATGLGALLQAEALLREATRVGPAPVTSVAKAAAEACLALADLFIRSGRLPAAREALDAARTFTPWDSRIALGRARVFELEGQTDQAVAQLEPLVSAAAGPDLAAAAALGDVLLRARRAEDVAVLASRVEAAATGSELAGALRAAAALGGDDPELAMAEAVSFVESNPTSVSAQLARGRAALASGALPIAREAFALALERTPGLIEAMIASLEVAERGGEPAAIRTCALGLLERPDARVWGLRAVLALSIRDPNVLAAAGERLDALVAARPKDARLRVLLGLLRLGQGRTDGGTADLLQPLLLAADLPGATSMLADTPEGMLQGVLAVEVLAVLMLRPDHPGDVAGRLLAARVLERLDRLALASALLGGSTAELGREATLLRVQLAVRSGALEEGVAALEALRVKEPGDGGVLAALGELQLVHGDAAVAREILEQAARSTPGSAAVLARLARARAGAGDLAGATEAYAAARELDARLAVAHEDAVLPLHAGDGESAATRLRAALAATGDPRCGFALVAVEAAMGRPGEALTVLSRAPPTDVVDAHLLVACLMVEAGESERALATVRAGPRPPRVVLQAIARRSTGSARRALWTLAALKALDWWVEARSCAEAIAADQGADALSLWWAWRAVERGDPALGVRLGERLAALAPDDEELTLLVAAARGSRGDAAGDAALVQALRRRGLQDPRLLVELGIALERAGEPGQAEACYRDACARGLGDAIASNNLAWLLAADPGDERRREARAHAREAVRQAPTSAEALDTLGWVYHVLGDDHDALPIVERAAARLPGNPTVRFHAAEILAALGRVDQARLTLEVALALPGGWPEEALARARLEALGRVR